jgi:two-component system response regulator GlrR
VEVIPLHIVSHHETSQVVDDFTALVAKEKWCSLKSLTRFAAFPSSEVSSRESLFVLIHDEPKQLSEAVRHLLVTAPHSIYIFTNLFRYPYPCLQLLKAGFDDFIVYPFRHQEIRACLRDLWSRKQTLRPSEPDSLRTDLTLKVALRDLIGLSPALSDVLNEIRIIGKSDAPVMITGETGTGKDLCARAIHYTSARACSPFIPVNCGSIPDELFENEFFGHERGAFTDARDKHPGLVREAEGGTVFLDDIECLSPRNQTKILRFIQEGTYLPLGSGKTRRANVRVIAATNTDLLNRLYEGSFREDLYYRLSVLQLQVPSLRERSEDIPALVDYFLERYCKMYNTQAIRIAENALKTLKQYAWPGNIRELESFVHSLVIHSSNPVIERVELPILKSANDLLFPHDVATLPFNQMKDEVIKSFERNYVERLLNECDWNVSAAARRAGKNRRAFWEIMRKHQITRPQR